MLYILQLPFNPKDLSNSIPVWIVAFAFLLYMGVWAAKALGLVKLGDQSAGRQQFPQDQAGELPESKWVLNITKIVQEENEKLRIRMNEELSDILRDSQKANAAIAVMHGLLGESERRIIAVVNNGK